MHYHQIYDYGVGFFFVCALINLALPPWESFANWPRFQSYYRLVSIFIGYWASINFKSRIWPQISVDNQVSKAVNGTKEK